VGRGHLEVLDHSIPHTLLDHTPTDLIHVSSSAFLIHEDESLRYRPTAVGSARACRLCPDGPWIAGHRWPLL